MRAAAPALGSCCPGTFSPPRLITTAALGIHAVSHHTSRGIMLEEKAYLRQQLLGLIAQDDQQVRGGSSHKGALPPTQAPHRGGRAAREWEHITLRTTG